MHQIRFWLGLCPRPRWGSLQRSPRPPCWIKGVLLLRGRDWKGGDERRELEGGEEREREGEDGGRGGREGKGRGKGGEEALLVMWPTNLSALNPPLGCSESTRHQLGGLVRSSLSSHNKLPQRDGKIWIFEHFVTSKVTSLRHVGQITFFSARQHAERAICYRPSVRLSVCLSVRPSVCHTGGSVKNG